MANVRHVIASGACGFVVIGLIGTSAALSQSSSTYGDIEVPAGSSGIVATVPLDAGGSDNSAELVSGCVGFINAEMPDLTITLQSPAPELVVSVRSAADTTLLVRKPDGTIHCDDDTEGLNPAVRLPKAGAGTYDVWVGVFEQVFAPAEVDVTLGGGVTPTPPAPLVAIPPTAVTPAADQRLQFDVPSDGTAAQIAAQISEAVEELRVAASLELGEEVGISTSAPIALVEETDGFYFDARGLNLIFDGGIVDLGNVRVGFSDPDAPILYWSIDDISEIAFLEDGQRAGNIKLGLSRVAGRYDRGMGTHLGYDIDLRDITFEDPEGVPLIEVGRVRLTMDLAREASGRFSGPVLFEIRNITINDPENRVLIGRIGFESRMRSVDIAAINALNLGAFADVDQAAAAGLETFARLLGSNFGNSDTELFVGGVRTKLPDGSDFSLGNLTFEIGYGSKEDLTELRIGGSVEGFDVDDPGIPQALREGSAKFRLAVEGLPLLAMANAVSGLDPLDESQQQLMVQALLGALLQSAPSLRLDTANIETADISISSGGRLELSSQMTPTGRFEVLVRGLPTLIQEARVGAAGAILNEDLLPLLEFARSIGVEVSNSPENLVFTIELTPDSKLVVNGLDLSQVQ